MKIELLHLGPITIYSYGLMIALGILACVFMGMHRAKKFQLNPEYFLDIAICGVVAGFLGAKLLYVIIEFDRFLQDPMSVIGSEGFVVYGGIIAGVLAAIIYSKRKKIIFLEYFDLAAPSIAIAQGFGRIGCFLAGCCYGRETHGGCGVIFPEGSLAPSGIPLIPTQLLSSLGDFLIMACLLVFASKAKKRKTGDVGALYLALYAVGRFFIEFLRADDRGGMGGLSTSQWISILILIGAAILFYRNRKAAAAQVEAGTEADAEAGQSQDESQDQEKSQSQEESRGQEESQSQKENQSQEDEDEKVDSSEEVEKSEEAE